MGKCFIISHKQITYCLHVHVSYLLSPTSTTHPTALKQQRQVSTMCSLLHLPRTGHRYHDKNERPPTPTAYHHFDARMNGARDASCLEPISMCFIIYSSLFILLNHYFQLDRYYDNTSGHQRQHQWHTTTSTHHHFKVRTTGLETQRRLQIPRQGRTATVTNTNGIPPLRCENEWSSRCIASRVHKYVYYFFILLFLYC
jgi:hypothetical protein